MYAACRAFGYPVDPETYSGRAGEQATAEQRVFVLLSAPSASCLKAKHFHYTWRRCIATAESARRMTLSWAR